MTYAMSWFDLDVRVCCLLCARGFGELDGG